MSLANVTLSSTFDEWRVRTNQLISLYDETNQLSRASYNATNLAAVTAANLAANVISGNSAVYNTIYASTNTITLNVLTQVIPTFYDAANASFDVANASIATANLTYNQANTARDSANLIYSTANGVFDAMNVEATITRTIANNAYDTANNFVANSANIVAEVLTSNTIIQNTINNSVTQLFVDYLANNDLTYVGNIANASFEKANTGDTTGITAFDTANAAYSKANTAGGGYFAGNNGYNGNASNKADIFRINSNTFTGNIVFAAGENASATGPLYMDANAMIQILDGARVVII